MGVRRGKNGAKPGPARGGASQYAGEAPNHGNQWTGTVLRPTPGRIAELTNYGRIGATVEEVAALTGVSVRTMYRFLEAHPEAREALERGKSLCRVSVRRMQVQQALAGDRVMLVWLGKNMLGQRDRHENVNVEVTAPDTGEAEMSLANLSIEELLTLEQLHNKARGARGGATGDDPPGAGGA